MKRKAKSWKTLVLMTGAAALAGGLWWGNTALELNEYVISSQKLPLAFEGFRIAHVTDLHNCVMGAGNRNLLALLEGAEPDIIVITGDLIDSRRTNVEVATRFVRDAAAIAPCYYVTGNHESRLYGTIYDRLESALLEVGTTVLHNEGICLERDGEQISLVGVDDPGFARKTGSAVLSEEPEKLRALFAQDDFNILLAHHPESLAAYAQGGADLVFSGHAHGGQVRLPFVGGIIAPHQGWLPQYDSGLYVRGETRMLLNRGVGNSRFPLRVNNRPEVVVAELRR